MLKCQTPRFPLYRFFYECIPSSKSDISYSINQMTDHYGHLLPNPLTHVGTLNVTYCCVIVLKRCENLCQCPIIGLPWELHKPRKIPILAILAPLVTTRPIPYLHQTRSVLRRSPSELLSVTLSILLE